MIDPKQHLTPVREVYIVKDEPQMYMAVRADDDFALQLAGADVVHEDDAAQFAALQNEFSISTIEEVAALARRDQSGTSFLADAGLPTGVGQRVLNEFAQTPRGAAELRDWERYDRFVYRSGCELDLNSPPTFTAAQTLGGAAATFAAPPAAAHAEVSLIGKRMPPVRDQGNRGTCVAFTTMACLEYYNNVRGEKTGLDLSEQYMYWNMVTQTGQRNLQSAYPLLSGGSCLEGTWPYFANELEDNDTQGPPPPFAAKEAPAYGCVRSRQLPPRDVDPIKNALAKDRLVGIGIPVYDSWFESAVVRKYGNITVPLPGEVAQTIGHAVTLVGYADDLEFAGGGYFIVRNSWGLNWATAGALGPGYGTIPYRYIQNFNWDAWCIES